MFFIKVTALRMSLQKQSKQKPLKMKTTARIQLRPMRERISFSLLTRQTHHHHPMLLSLNFSDIKISKTRALCENKRRWFERKVLTEIVESLSPTRTNDAFRSLPATPPEEDADAIFFFFGGRLRRRRGMEGPE